MNIIPVLDLRGGVVVRARRGERQRYQPIVSPLSSTSDPGDVTRGLLTVHPFTTFYVADLDAIAGTGDNTPVLRQLKAEFPALAFWVDNGIAHIAAAERWLDGGFGDLVVGSESQKDIALVRHLAGRGGVVLSLDFRGDAFQGPPALLEDVAAWPQRLIVMTLARVGSGAGPDLARLRAIRAAAPDRTIFAAGGVRDAADLTALRQERISGALVATSLHDGRLRGTDIAAA
ncbi:MAG: nickel transporter [Bradyrhizobiaceae bacterium]|nr:nickel transporter [Bradyrhizobiaceae bacterium]